MIGREPAEAAPVKLGAGLPPTTNSLAGPVKMVKKSPIVEHHNGLIDGWPELDGKLGQQVGAGMICQEEKGLPAGLRNDKPPAPLGDSEKTEAASARFQLASFGQPVAVSPASLARVANVALDRRGGHDQEEKKSTDADHLGHENMERRRHYAPVARKTNKRAISESHDTTVEGQVSVACQETMWSLISKSSPSFHDVDGDQAQSGAGNSQEACQLIEYNATRLQSAGVGDSPPDALLVEAGNSQKLGGSSTTDKMAEQQVGGGKSNADIESVALVAAAAAKVNQHGGLLLSLRDSIEGADLSGSSFLIEPQPSNIMRSQTDGHPKRPAGRCQLAKSQPDLSTMQATQGSSKLAAPLAKRAGGARIAVPVQARRSSLAISISSPAKHPVNQAPVNKTITQQKPKRAVEFASHRSKSSLESSSLPRRTTVGGPTGAKLQPATIRQKQTSSTACNQQAGKLAEGQQRRHASDLLASKNDPRSRSLSSIGFVTQIPTLISQSHASSDHSSSSSSSSSSSTVKQAWVIAAPSSSAPKEEEAHSNSVSPQGSNQPIRKPSADAKGEIEPPEGGSSKLPVKETAERETLEEILDELPLRKALSQSCSLLPKATPQSVGADNHQPTTNNANTPAHKSTMAAAGSTGCLLVSPATRMQQQQQQQPGEGTKQEKTIENKAGQQLACSQCKLYQLKLNLLIKDRKQLNEQISELEEMENDSRLMSQNLAQKLFSIEQQFDGCKLELEKSYQSEAKLQFQVKRLSLELKERFDCVQQLQAKLAKLQAKLSSRQLVASGPTGLAGADCCKKSASDRQQSGNNADNSIIAQSTKSPQSVDSSSSTSSKASSIANDDVPARAAATSGSSDDDSAIDSTFDERNKSSATLTPNADLAGPTGSLPSHAPATFGQEEEEEERRIGAIKLQCDDSLYSKSSSASSYANSDDGCRSEPDQLLPATANHSNLSPGSASDEPRPSGNSTGMAASLSPSSSGDESDHHQSFGSQGANINGSPSGGGSEQNRQQVLRKKTSTARGQRNLPTQTGGSKRQPICGGYQEELPEQPELPKLVQAQARFLQVLVTDSTSTTTTTSFTESSLREPAEAKKPSAGRESSPIELALKGVDDLEKGRLDEAFRALAEVSSSVSHGFESNSKEAEEERHKLGLYKQEIANLRLRLLQAQALNDNLVAQLKTCNDRNRSEQHNNQQQQQQLHARRCSVIYVNGVGAGCPQAAEVNPASGSNNFYSLNPNGAHQLYQQAIDNKHRLEAELVEFLRFLLDKIHFHHGRTFELVNECQKLAMKALRASYSHQMNLVHHNEVVLAGNQASLQVLPPGQQQQQQQPIDRYPVRPPPRRRNNSLNLTASCEAPLEPSSNRMSMQPDDGQSQATGKSGIGESRPPPPPTVRYSALQVAKQTLFSIVPIYHGGANSAKSSKGSKERALEAKLSKQDAVAGFADLASKASNPNGNSMKNCFVKINQTANDSNVSVLEINNRNVVYHQRQQQATSGLDSDRVNCSLSEDIERFRVHFNGQLLDLLTRQNSCESIIAEKLKLLTHSGYSGQSSVRQETNRSHFTINSSSSSSSCSISSANGGQATNIQQITAKHLPMTNKPFNSIANIPMTNNRLNPNCLATQSQQQQPMRQSWIINQSQDSSLC